MRRGVVNKGVKMKIEIPMDRQEKKLYELEQIQALVDQNGGLVKTADILALGIDYRRILQYMEAGDLRRVKNGYYSTKIKDYSEEELIVTMFADGVLTMESALYYYGYLKQRPAHWRIAVSKNISKSRFSLEYPIVIPYYTEETVLKLGVDEIEISNRPMKIYTKDRLICDVLKYKDKMEHEDVKEGVLAYIADDSKDVEALMEYAKQRKVSRKVMSMIGVWL